MGNEIKVTMRKLVELVPYENNPRDNSKAVNAVAESIREFGFKNPIIVDKGDVIVAGHTRYKAAEKLGLDEVPVIVADDLSDEQVKAFRLADNKTAELAEWNFDLLETELAGISEIDMSAFGFDIDVDSDEAETTEDNYSEPDDLPEIAKLGGCYSLGNHKLIVGDSTKEETIAQLCEREVDLLVTDPPYNVDYTEKSKWLMNSGLDKTTDELKKIRDKQNIANDKMTANEFVEFLARSFIAASARIKKGGAFYIWYASTVSKEIFEALELSKLPVRQQLIWVKNQLVFGRQDYHWKHEPCVYGWKEGAAHYFINDHTLTTLLEDNQSIDTMKKKELQSLLWAIMEYLPTTTIEEKRPSANVLHPTMKPVPLIGRLIKNSSRKGEIVLDPFGGSGTTLIACEQLGRSCRMVELDEHYANVIIDRWQKLTGEKAKEINVN